MDLGGIEEKLKRADESIRNLNREIALFLDEPPGRTISNDNTEAVSKFLEEHSKRIIPPRFSVLGGEIIHHLRSVLDHIAWQLATVKERRDHPTQIEFPIFDDISDPKKASRFKGKIEGLLPAAHTLVESLQPYSTGRDGLDDPLWIIHKMDITDKHRELVLAVIDPKRSATWFLPKLGVISLVSKQHPAREITVKTSWGGEVKVQGDVTVHVSFGQFGKRENQPIIPALSQLLSAVKEVVRKFAAKF